MDDTVRIPDRSGRNLARRDLEAMATADLVALRDRAHQQEQIIAVDNAAYLGGRGPEMESWHRLWLWCSMELDRRGSLAAAKGADRVMKQIIGDAE